MYDLLPHMRRTIIHASAYRGESTLQEQRRVTRLHDLSLTEEVLRESLGYGHSHWAECTQNDPATLPGYVMWGKTIRRLRELLKPQGWTIDNRENCQLTVHPLGQFAIMVVAGDSGTGNSTREPATRYERGPATRKLFPSSQLSFLFYHLSQPPPREIWMLLHHHDPTGILMAELSLPLAVTEDGYVTGWRERIILDLEELNPIGQVVPRTDTPPAIDVPVRMKP